MKHTVAFLFCIFFYIIGYAQRTVNTSATQDSVQISLSATPEVVTPPAQSNSNINPKNHFFFSSAIYQPKFKTTRLLYIGREIKC